MRKVWTEVSYSKFTGHEFNPKRFLKELVELEYAREAPIYIFDKNKRLKVDRESFQAIVEKPPRDLLEKAIKEYFSYRERLVKQRNKSYELSILPSGEISLDFLIDGKRLISSDGDVYVGTIKKEEEIAEKIKEWSKISKNLGFEPLPPETLTLKDSCEAIKLCTKFRKLSREDVLPYIMDTLLPNLEDSRLILYSLPSSLTIDKNRMSFLARISSEMRKDAEFALELMGGPKKEPRVGIYTEAKTWWDAINEWYNAHEETFNFIAGMSFFPALGLTIGTVWGGLMSEAPLSGAGIGITAGLGIDGLICSYYSIINWRERKREERELALKKFSESMLKRPHLKRPYGACVILSTDKCITKSAKKESEKQESKFHPNIQV